MFIPVWVIVLIVVMVYALATSAESQAYDRGYFAGRTDADPLTEEEQEARDATVESQLEDIRSGYVA